jgi:hypothetical protein
MILSRRQFLTSSLAVLLLPVNRVYGSIVSDKYKVFIPLLKKAEKSFATCGVASAGQSHLWQKRFR